MKTNLGNTPRKKLGDISNLPLQKIFTSQDKKPEHILTASKEYIEMIQKVHFFVFVQCFIVLINVWTQLNLLHGEFDPGKSGVDENVSRKKVSFYWQMNDIQFFFLL